MIIAIIAYFVSFFCVKTFKKQKVKKLKNFPHLKMQKSGIVFNSFDEHRIKIAKTKTMQIGNVLYIKLDDELVVISNVNDVKICEGYLYFKCLGEVKITFNFEEFYRYFLIKIKSQQFSLNKLKQCALRDLINHNFNLKFSKIAQKYIKIINNVLNIQVFSKKIIVKSNKFKLSYTLTYKLNNVIKHVVINERI